MYLRYLATLPLLPYIRRELPQYRRMLHRIIGQSQLTGWPAKTIRGKLHGLKMHLDLNDWCERWTFFLGRYYEDNTQLLLQAALRPNDVFIDIGTNIGMISMLAAKIVGAGGRVISFEPNPDVFAKLRRHIDDNQLGAIIQPHNVALGSQRETLKLRLRGLHTGHGTLADVQAEPGEAVREIPVPVEIGDEVLASAPSGPMLIKIDVEGFEPAVLRGLNKTLATRHPAVITETIPAHLDRAGFSAKELWSIMQGHGYRGYNLGAKPGTSGWASHRLALWPCPTPDELREDDVLWLSPGAEHDARLRPFIAE